MKKYITAIGLSIAASWLLLNFTASSVRADENKNLVQPRFREQLRDATDRFLLADRSDASDLGGPEYDPPAGTSGPCSNDKSLIPISLETKRPDNWVSRWSRTTAANPPIWFYIPPYDSVVSARFSLKRWEGDQRSTASISAYETVVSVPSSSGAIQIQIPPNTLETNQWYEAKLAISMYCQPGVPLSREFTRVWIKQEAVDPILSHNLAQASTHLQRAILYADAGFWYDALTTLEPGTSGFVSDDWASLLCQFGLEAIATEPITSCCTPIEPEQ